MGQRFVWVADFFHCIHVVSGYLSLKSYNQQKGPDTNLVHVAQPFLDEAHPSTAKLATSHLDNEVGRQLGGIRISFASNIAMTDCHLHVSHRISKPVSPQNPR